ncbi:biotin-dependent carboxyltransferase family protein [Eubacterium coprostanoligenes]|uniref:5-oxoprolinase subunit C family protein n=1 Tax=Eubacterium coprostanoligenes TaxID=290054 RepID=UPI00235404F1|nr:biotin-dependent carboxyltransferase family protein [Eubacterium coprostanoligenes]MCI6253505.1 biotin-dependent carboxyltransferase family protein [Eubacterium coprostanoligenes]MDY5400130.1 biotin-dependent carboxyltransferase family protein [Eubacterium coprostanoligenes]
MIEIITPGLLTTVQDFGRVGVMKNGFTQNGAMDRYSMTVANRLCGNCDSAPVLEMTVLGVTARFTQDTVVCVSGADFGAKINDKPIKRNKAYKINKGDILSMGTAKSGMRAYLAVAGGIVSEYVFGSASTNLKFAFGGHFGKKLQSGDVLSIGTGAFPLGEIDKWEIPESEYSKDAQLRVVLGPQNEMFTDEDIRLFLSQEYEVTAQSDRMGIRLSGEPLKSKNGMDIISDGIVFGSVQVPNSGEPIILMADHQTTGGYAKIATVISVDLPRASQLSAGNTVRFKSVTVEEAEQEAKKQKRFFDNLYMF